MNSHANDISEHSGNKRKVGSPILVTGATGMSGAAIIRQCARHRLPVRALVRSRKKAHFLGSLAGIEVFEGDMAKPETLSGTLEGAERVLMISSAGPQMLETQCKFIDACQKAGVRHLIKFSGKESGIGFDPRKFRFTAMHEDIERHLENSKLAWTHLRPSGFMQTYLREAPTIASKSAIFLPFGNIKLSPIDIEDIAQIAFALLRDGGHEGKSFDMTGPEALTMADIAQRISDAIGKSVRYVNVAPEDRRRALIAAGIPPAFADALDEQAAERRLRPESRVYLGTHELFGVQPTTFSDFARRNAAVFKGGTLKEDLASRRG